jgi:pimeloyl-ACP methyl ester carboxylesterase
MLLVAGCASVELPEEDVGVEAKAHFRRTEGLREARATSETMKALAARSWQQLPDADAAARFESGAGSGSPDWLYASELRLMAGGKENSFLGARDAWRWLAASNGGRNQPAALRQRAYRLYNHNVAAYAASIRWEAKTDRVGSMAVELKRNGLARESFAAILTSYFVEPFDKPIITSGAGGPVLALFPRSPTRDAKWPYLLPDNYAKPLSAVLDFQGGKATLTLHDPREGESVALFGRTVPLKVDYTAGLALNQIPPADTEEGLERPDASQQTLYMLAPPDPRRRVLLFVHGFNSGPEVFRNLALTLFKDPELRAHYQIVAYRYATGYSLFINNAMFRTRLRAFYEHLGEDARAAGTVAIGHSMGGLQIKPLAQASGQLIWDRVFQHPPGRLKLDTVEGEEVKGALIFEPLPEIRRLVFLAVPHRGSALASGIAAQVTKSQIAEDPDIRAFKQNLLRDYGAQMRPPMRRRLQREVSSVDSLRPDDLYRNLLLRLPIRVPFHSVIADIDGSQDKPTGDGVVPYASAHLEGAVSEKIIQWGHNVTSSPDCMAEVRRILIEHLR